MKERHQVFLAEIADVPPEKMVFLDETGSNLSMTPTHAWAPSGVCAHAKRPTFTSNLSVLGAVRLSGLCAWHGYDGAVDGDRFVDYLKNKLVPTLTVGDVVIMDNARIHKVEGVQATIEAVGARAVYLPPYSPQLNPIELVWSLLKRQLRHQAARSVAAWFAIVNSSLRALTRSTLDGFFKHAASFHHAS